MKLRVLLSAALALCLAFSCASGLAAPTRDLKALEVTMDEKLLTLTELTVNAAILQGMPVEPGGTLRFSGLEKGETPSDSLVACVMAWGVTHGALPYAREIAPEEETVPLRVPAAQMLYDRVFTSDSYAFPENQTADEIAAVKARYKYRTWYAGSELNVKFAGKQEGPNYGVYIYSAEFDGTDVTLLCDVFATTGEDFHQAAEDVPEEALTWMYNAEISLRYAPEKPFGYTVNGFSFSPAYQDGALSQWVYVENTGYEYSVNLPTLLQAVSAKPDCRSWQNTDGSVTLTIEAREGGASFDDALAKFLLAHPAAQVTQERMFSSFYCLAEGSFTLVFASEDLSWTYELTMTFPPEKQAEYSLYAEIIRNSLSVWGISNG